MVPVKRVRSESLDEIGHPANLSAQIHRCERAALEIDEYTFSIGGRRRIAARTVAVLACVLLAERCLPKLFSSPIKGQNSIHTVHWRCQVNALLPNGGCGAAFSGQ